MVCANAAFGLSDLEIREQRSSAINSVKKNECGTEDAEARKRIEYATALVFHNEMEEAKATLIAVAKEAKTPTCRQALEKIAGEF